MRYMAAIDSNNSRRQWIEIEADSLHSAQQQATHQLDYGYQGDKIRLVEVGEELQGDVNDLPCWIRPVKKGGRWRYRG